MDGRLLLLIACCLTATAAADDADHEGGRCRFGDGAADDNGALHVAVVHPLFRTDVLHAGLTYEVVLKKLHENDAPIHFTLISYVDHLPKGRFLDVPIDECGSNVLRSRLKTTWISYNWTAEDGGKITATGNLTFRLIYSTENDPSVYETGHTSLLTEDCRFDLVVDEATVTSLDLPPAAVDCRLRFPGRSGADRALAVELWRLNVPCTKGYVRFANATPASPFGGTPPPRLCGKLEELADNDRRLYFRPSPLPHVHLHGSPVFTIHYRLVDRCHNVTLAAPNGSVEVRPGGGGVRCTFRIFLPYGNRVALTLDVGVGRPIVGDNTLVAGPSGCNGLLAEIHDGDGVWSHCARPGDAARRIEVVSRANKVVLKVTAHDGGASTLGVAYRAEAVEEIVGVCGYGWVALGRFCATAIETMKMSWSEAETECGRRGGHLVSVRNADDQNIIDKMLLNSPGYRDHNAYWIGASDRINEGDFRWSDGLAFSYTNWFPGWNQHAHYNKQPNDDGLSGQDCVEVRRMYALPASSASLAVSFMWNDRDCTTVNYFVCERLQSDEPLENAWPPDCNHSLDLSRQQPKASVSSPGFPRRYPDNAVCETDVAAPAGYRIVLDFEELVLEEEPACSYDYLEIVEAAANASQRFCGDWSAKLKLLRYVSNGSRLKLRFSSDYSHHFGGYKARVSMENTMQCADDRLHLFNDSCYLFVSYPEVTWKTARQICEGIRANLASILTLEEERFITTNIRRTNEYRTSELYWLGARAIGTDFTKWLDGNAIEYLGWLPDHDSNVPSNSCLAIRWLSSPKPSLPSGLYWKAHRCEAFGGYVCKRPNQHPASTVNYNKKLNGSSGNITTPNYPGNYYNNLDMVVRIVGPDRTRLIIRFLEIDIEYQLECLYDFVELGSGRRNDSVKWCGNYDDDMHRFDFVSKTNEAFVKFHTDYSITGKGFLLEWKAVDVSACPMQTLTAKEGFLTSPNYPDFLLTHLDCSVTIVAPMGKRIWVEFLDYDLQNEDDDVDFMLEISLGGRKTPKFQPFQTKALLTEGSFISNEERLQIHLRTGSHPAGNGFRAFYKIIQTVREEKTIHLEHNTTGHLLHLNYPDFPAFNVDFLQRYVAPLGHIIFLELYYVKIDVECSEVNGMVKVYDNYYDQNGTIWKLCYDDESYTDRLFQSTPIAISSYLNTLHLRQTSGDGRGVSINGTLRVQKDDGFKEKLLAYKERGVETCNPNPCQNGGKCLTKDQINLCQCVGHFTGLFCALTKCELEPCVFGTCELTDTSYKCHCKNGYTGPNCEQKRRPCEGNPCESRGVCIERGDGFKCRCHAWWEGARCEKRMLHIPYKPLSERMFHEPFWLGLMTVFIVMAVIGLVWCAKRHFPEKIEKLLAEEGEGGRVSSLRSSSVREQLAAASTAVNSTVAAPSPGPGTTSRSLFGRLGIRKPSILSLTSPHAAGGYVPATARTFSLDDLLKPPPRRSPSPKKKRNNSTPTKKNAAEKKQILQQLISPVNKPSVARKVNFGELIQLSEKMKTEEKEQQSATKETRLDESIDGDPKLEKKVTFARLLNRVSAEINAGGTELELGVVQAGCSLFARPSSTPPSPNTNTAVAEGSADSLAGSELAIPAALSTSLSDFLSGRRLPNGRPKPASADSILAMLRRPPSATPSTLSSPQDDDDESSASLPTPSSYDERPQTTIEVPVLDTLSAAGGNLAHPPTVLLEIPSAISKCLSPIRELPTPLPSPALTPSLCRRQRNATTTEDVGSGDERIAIGISETRIMDGDVPEIVIDFQAEDGLILEEAAALQQSSKSKIRPPPLGQPATPTDPAPLPPPPPLVIPTLTIQTPSPTHAKTTPTFVFPGSPPPYRSHDHPFAFAPVHRRPLKDLDKPMSLELPGAPPTITITCNHSDADSDADLSVVKPATLTAPPPGTTLLSPFIHNISESNLSSSGYSSMASPGPSRCGSSNPLCPPEAEGRGGAGRRRPAPAGPQPGPGRGRSDSETLSDEPALESNDEGIGTDHIDEKIEEGDVRSAKELEVFIAKETARCSLQLPAIVVQCDTSPMSSRSESPLSEKTSARFSTQFYGRNKEILPFTDSDGLYDFPSTDRLNALSQKKSRKREKKTTRNCKTPSPTKPHHPLYNHLDVPLGKDGKVPPPRKLSPKRRVSRSQVCSSSSSSDSLHDTIKFSSSPSTDTVRWSSPINWHPEDNEEEPQRTVLPPKPNKLSRLRAISHQIRFLRRLELSLKRRERAISPSESLDSGGDDDSPRATSPLLQKSSPKLEIKKSNSIGLLQSSATNRNRNKYKRDELLLDEKSWKRIVITGNGHSD